MVAAAVGAHSIVAALLPLNDVVKLPDVPFRILAACAKDEYRKPMPGMWNELERIFKEDNVEISRFQPDYTIF